MVTIHDDGVFPAPLSVVWKLLGAHQDDSTIPTIHPLVVQQHTVHRGSPDSVVDRIVNARGRQLRSRWKLTYRPPDLSRWEILESEGPWKVGSFLENHYSGAPGGTRIVTRGELHITVLPFFLPQGWFSRRILRDIDAEDAAFLPRLDSV